MDARPDDLVAFAIDEALKRVPELDRGEIVDVMVGCGFPQERQGMNLARRAALLAGLPETVPGTTERSDVATHDALLSSPGTRPERRAFEPFGPSPAAKVHGLSLPGALVKFAGTAGPANGSV